MKYKFLNLILACQVAMSALSMQANDDNYTWHGYYDGEEALSEFGTGMIEDYDCAVYFSGEVGAVSGKNISKVRFRIQGVDMAENVQVWLSTKLPETADGANVGVYNISVDGIAEGDFIEVKLDEPYWVTKQGVYVGYSFSTKEPFPILTTDALTSEGGGFYLKTSKSYSEWKDFSQFKNGNLALQVLVDGKIYANAARIVDVPEVVGLTGNDITLPVKIMNNGLDGITSVEYSVQSDEGEPIVAEYELPEPVKEIMQTFELPLAFECGKANGISYKKVSILKVNGHENEVADGMSGTGAVIAVEEGAPRSTVMEEFTGTWCGWCPRGAVGMEQLSKDFGNGFIGIAIHRNDPMEIPEYAEMLESVSGYPSCQINRNIYGDPFFGSNTGPGVERSYGVYDNVLEEQNAIVPAMAGISSEWIDKDNGVLQIIAKASLSYDRQDSPNYRVAYVVCADSLRKDEVSWFQSNDFSLPMAQANYKDDPYLGWLTEKGTKIVGFVYNDVAIAAAGVDNGLPLSYSGAWQKGVMTECGKMEFDLSSNDLVQNKDNLNAVILLLDASTGKIVNGAKAPIGKSGTSKVDELAGGFGEREVQFIYDISGRRLDSVRKGMNIVVYSDGTVEKKVVTQ